MITTSKDKISKLSIQQIIFYYLMPYTVAFLLLQFIVFYAFSASGKSFVWKIDGLSQHYPVLLYYSQFLKNLLSGKGIAMIDFNVGMGFDVLTTLNYYAIGDPISLLTVFANPENMEGFYQFLIILRVYLAGVSFVLYCYFMKEKGYPSVLGGLIYVFCGFLFYACTRHPYFINPMIYLPLLLIGLEKVLQKKKPYVFIIMVFVSTLSNFYFFFMLTIIIFAYAVIRFFCTYKKAEGKSIYLDFLQTLIQTAFYYILGIIMSAALLLPVLVAFLNNGRFDSGYEVNLLYYTKGNYVKMLNSFLAPNSYSGYWTHLTYAAIVTIGIILVFRRKNHKELKIGFILATICLLVPLIGYIMNGFAYVSNRWGFGYSFLIAFIFVATYKEMFCLEASDKLLLLLGTAGYAALGMIRPSKYIWIALLFLCLTIVIIFYFNRYKKYVNLQKACIFLLVFCNLGANGFLTYYSKYGNYVNEFVKEGKVQETIENTAVSIIPKIEDDSFYRIETYGDSIQNKALTIGYHGVAGYFSIMDSNVTQYMKGLELINLKAACRFDDFNNRTILNTLASVKYLVTSDMKVAPYGYRLISKELEGKPYYLYENQNALPLGYTYNKFITNEDYQKLTALEKQDIMLQAVVVEEGIDGMTQLLRENNIGNLTSIQERNVSYELDEGIIIEGDTVKVTKKGSKIRVHFTGMEKAEIYLRLEDFNIDDSEYYSIDLKVNGENQSVKTINVRAKKNNSYFGKEDYLVNLGYAREAVSYCDITFKNKGMFHLGDLQVFVLPMQNYKKQVTDLKEFTLQNIIIKNNRVTGNITLKENRLLCLSIPYSKGWTAYVNGERTEILQANVLYMAIPLQAGNSNIELVYTTPYLKMGIGMSGIGWVIFIGIIIYNRNKKTR